MIRSKHSTQSMMRTGTILNRPDNDGLTPLHWELIRGNEPVVNRLLATLKDSAIQISAERCSYFLPMFSTRLILINGMEKAVRH